MQPSKYYNLWQRQLAQAKKEDNMAGGHSKKIANLEHKCAMAKESINLEQKIEKAAQELQKEDSTSMKELWQEEIAMLQAKLNKANETLVNMLIPSAKQSIIMEIRAGEGGEEASIFAMELSNMYTRACKKKNWDWKVFSMNYSEVGGLKEGIFEITGPGIATWLDCESGVHCVKRVPRTEKKGRIHTSTATVAILLEPEDLDVTLLEKDLKIDVFRSSGPGGQSVNTTDSAVRITHIPTGIVVSQQDEKSQHKNKEKALKILKARIYEKKLQEAHSAQASERKQAVGRAKRNERIRTYHFLQNWVKDERLDTACHSVSNFMEGDILINFLEALVHHIQDEDEA